MRGADLRPHIEDPIELEKGETVVRISSSENSATVRKAIFGTLGALDLEPHKEGMILTEDELKTVKDEVLPQFPNLLIHDFWNPKAPNNMQLISMRNDTKEKATAEKAGDSYSILYSDNPHSLPDRDWAHFNRMMSGAEDLASKVSVNFVKKGQYHFYYEGHGIDWRNGGENLITEKDLSDWMTQVDSGEFNEDEEQMTG